APAQPEPASNTATDAPSSTVDNVPDWALVMTQHAGNAEHADQADLLALVQAGAMDEAFAEAFHLGDELFETTFNSVDGVGAQVGNGLRFSQLPRADLNGPGEWATHFPPRITGPNAEACNACHGTPMDDGAGRAANNNVRDPLHSGDIALFIQRNTPHVFGAGAVQVLAEEMTEELQAQRDAGIAAACAENRVVTVWLNAKNVDFGRLTISPRSGQPCQADTDTFGVVGVNRDLIVRPFQWKGVDATIRGFNRGAAHQELGMQSVEIVGEGVDGDFDGVVDELTVGDQTALAVYLAAQPRPTSLVELSTLGLIDPLDEDAVGAIQRGSALFAGVGCTSCHAAQMIIQDPVFYEPSQNPNYRDARFPAGQDPIALGVDPAQAIRVDLTHDQPDNQIETTALGGTDGIYRLGALATDAAGQGIVALYGDLKRHDMGPELAESIDDEGIPASVYLTENLWGVGSTAPYLHDGRATTLAEAILAHGGEAAASRSTFMGLSATAQADIIAFLNNLVLYKAE
ncbi:MAG: di-heme oxidoredictase family protein, partial [Caldilineaceae bacterium]